MQSYIKKITLLLLIMITLSVVGGCSLSSTTAETTIATTNATTAASTTAESSTTDVTTGVTTTGVTTTGVTTTGVTTTEATTTGVTTTETTTTGVTTTEVTTTGITTTEASITLNVIVINGEYTLGDDFNQDSILVSLVRPNGTAIPLSSSSYTVSGFNSTIVGEITLMVNYYEYSATFNLNIVAPLDGLIITMAYYFDAQGLTGSALFNELDTIVNTGFQGVTYGEARYILDESDADPTNPNNIILVYLATSISNVWDYGDTWNREHVWPQSLLPDSADNDTVNTCSDLHNLKPADPSENSSRGNKYFDTESGYEPRDEVKGDIARILFYMITKYSQLSLVDRAPGVLEMAMFSVLLQWHELDPVDDFERNRNDVIYSYQNNRNPYIDYPEFVDMIWG